MKTKFYGNQYVRVYHKIASFVKKTIAISAVITTAGWLVYGGMAYEKMTSKPALVEAQVASSTTQIDSMPPILDRIIKCESGGSQFDKNGQVLLNANDNHTVDEGWGQINLQVWGKKATMMGYDLSKEKDNKEFTKWLFNNYGDQPWYSSKACWIKK